MLKNYVHRLNNRYFVTGDAAITYTEMASMKEKSVSCGITKQASFTLPLKFRNKN